MELLRALPAVIVPGDSYDVRLELSDYPATAGWSVVWFLAGPVLFQKASTPDGPAHILTLTTTDTAQLGAGSYRAQLRVTDGTRAHSAPATVVTVDHDLARFRPAVTDGPGYWDALIAACRGQILANMQGGGMASYMVAGRQVMFQSMDQVRRVLAWAESERARARRGSAFGKVRVHLTRGW